MIKYLFVNDFYLNRDRKTLTGKLPKQDKSLVGARLKVTEYSEVTGFVIQVFEVGARLGVYPQIAGVKFDDGDIFGEILIDKGWARIESGEVKKFYIETRHGSSGKATVKKTLIGKWLGFRNISRKCFGKYYLDIRGGETGGQGQNEHGLPHVHIVEFKTQRELGKIYFPEIQYWKKDGSLLTFQGADITRKMKNDIIQWFNSDNLQNLIALNREWNSMNKFNSRATKNNS